MKKISLLVLFFIALSIQTASFMTGCSDNNPNRVPLPPWNSNPPRTPILTPIFTPTLTSTPAPFTTPQTTPQPTVDLGTAGNYVVLAFHSITSNGPSTICGSLGVFPGNLVDAAILMDCGGTQDVGNSAASTAQTDLSTAYGNAAVRTNGAFLVPGTDIGGQTLYPGLYQAQGDLLVSSRDLSLDAGGDPNLVFLFQINGNLIVAPSRKVLLLHGANAANVYWQVTGTASLGSAVSFSGTIMANSSIALGNGAVLAGRALSENSDVSLLSDTITHP